VLVLIMIVSVVLSMSLNIHARNSPGIAF